MPQNETLANEPGNLKPPQIQVLAALLGGSTVTAAAKAGGVDRTTVHRWLHHDWDFQAALHRARRELHASLRARLEQIAERAVEALSVAIEFGDAHVALALVKGLGLLDGRQRAIPTDNPAVLRQEVELAERQAASERQLRGLGALA